MREKFAGSRKSNPTAISINGKVTNNYEFEIWPVGEIAYTRKYQKPVSLVYMKGELIPNGGETAIVVQLVPYTAWAPLICSIVVGIISLFRFVEIKSIILLIASLILLLIVPTFIIGLILDKKERLKANLAKLFDFKHIKAV